MPQIVYSPDAVPPMPVFSQATISRGMVYVSGNIGCTRDLKGLVEGGVQAQTVTSQIFFSFEQSFTLVLACCFREHVQGTSSCRSWPRAHRQSKRVSDRHVQLWAYE